MARILVVDDEPDERFLVGRTLKKQGHEVSDAENGTAGLQAAREWAPDLVVTDIMMPVMDGVEFIRCMRGDPATAIIPILAASGDVHLAEAADAILKKPYPDRRLIEIVRVLLEKGCNGCLITYLRTWQGWIWC